MKNRCSACERQERSEGQAARPRPSDARGAGNRGGSTGGSEDFSGGAVGQAVSRSGAPESEPSSPISRIERNGKITEENLMSKGPEELRAGQ